MKLTLGWWNTSLSPIKRLKDRASPADRDLAGALIGLLLDTYQLDLLALCEVSKTDITAIQNFCDPGTYAFDPILSNAGRGAFDMCVITRKDSLIVRNSTPSLTIRNKQTLRVAQVLTLAIANEPDPLHVFLSHWASRLHMQQAHHDRHTLGTRLRDEINKVLDCNVDATIVLAGDYNDEPFNISLEELVLASRDKTLVAKRSSLFYNPFWRHLSHFDFAHNGQLDDRGTYFERNGKLTRWRTFDQMIFSSAFIRGKKWRLNEEQTRPVQMPEFSELLAQRNHFDHLPITGQIEKKEP